ncbi:transposon-related protein [Staphylococcus aureus]|nr:CHAP domain-containing protein [Staphylococcus aureus]CXZ21751.1 transposon-related protein [Staphylococcus aureus]
MKHKSVYLLCFLILPILLLTSVSAYAVSNPVGEPSHAVKPKIEKYDLSHYRSIYSEKGDWNPFGQEEISRQINNVSDFFFSMTKILAGVTDYAIENLFQLDVINDFADKIGDFVGDIYQKLLSNLALTLFIIVCFNAFIIFSVQGNAREALKRAFLIMCLIGFGVGILANAGNIIRGTNNIGKDLNNIIMNSTSSIDGNIDYIHENSGMNHIRNQLFDMTIYRTYLVMNYGTVDEKEIKAKGKDRIDNILKLDYDKKSEKELDDIVKDEVEKKNNKYMTQGYVFQKLAISVIGFIITLFMSIVFLSISFAKLIFSTFALFLFLFLVFSWIVSFIPGFELSVFSAFAKTLGYIILSACMTFLFVIVGLCIKLANSFIEPDSQNAYFLNSIFIIVILFVMYKKRAQIINFVSRGNISFSPSAIGAGVMNRTQERFNKIRHEQAQNKKAKRENQRDEPAPPLQNDNDLRRRQQDKPMPLFINKDNQKNGNKRREQQESMNGNDVKSASVESNANNYSKQPQKASQQEHQVRETRQRKDIQRSPQVVNQPLNNENHSINRKEQKSVQTAYDTDVQKRQIQNATRQNNPLSVMGSKSIHDSTYPTIEDGLNAGAKNLYDVYISKGLDTPKKIGPKYAPVGASNDPNNMNARWIPTVEKIMKDLGGSEAKTSCSNGKGKSIKFNGKLPHWSNDDPGKGNLYTAGQCTWYAYGMRQKMGKPVSTYWHDAHKWNDRAKAEGYKVDKNPEPGALFIAEQGAGGHDGHYGHVAVVIGVSDGGKTFRITEMNWEGAFKVNERTLKMTDGYSFIHDKE